MLQDEIQEKRYSPERGEEVGVSPRQHPEAEG
jgi:hypothetical protein